MKMAVPAMMRGSRRSGICSREQVGGEAHAAVRHECAARLKGSHAEDVLEVGRHIAVEHVDGAHAEHEDGGPGDDARVTQERHLLACGGRDIGRAGAGQHEDERRAHDEGHDERADDGVVPLPGGGDELARRGGDDHGDGELGVYVRNGDRDSLHAGEIWDLGGGDELARRGGDDHGDGERGVYERDADRDALHAGELGDVGRADGE